MFGVEGFFCLFFDSGMEVLCGACEATLRRVVWSVQHSTFEVGYIGRVEEGWWDRVKRSTEAWMGDRVDWQRPVPEKRAGSVCVVVDLCWDSRSFREFVEVEELEVGLFMVLVKDYVDRECVGVDVVWEDHRLKLMKSGD